MSVNRGATAKTSVTVKSRQSASTSLLSETRNKLSHSVASMSRKSSNETGWPIKCL